MGGNAAFLSFRTKKGQRKKFEERMLYKAKIRETIAKQKQEIARMYGLPGKFELYTHKFYEVLGLSRSYAKGSQNLLYCMTKIECPGNFVLKDLGVNGNIKVSKETEDITDLLTNTVEFAHSKKHYFIGTDHLVYALANTENALSRKTLKELNIVSDTIEGQLKVMY